MTIPSTEPRTAFPEHFQARICGRVQHRVGDGQIEDIPLGLAVQVATALASMVLSWESDGQPVNVTVAKDEFEYYVATGAIEVQEADLATP